MNKIGDENGLKDACVPARVSVFLTCSYHFFVYEALAGWKMALSAIQCEAYGLVAVVLLPSVDLHNQ